MYVCAPPACLCPWRQEGDIGIHGTRVIGTCEPPSVGAGDQPELM